MGAIAALRTVRRGGPGAHVDVAMLDEGQDNSPLMWRCFEKMVSGAQRVYMAGDDDQAIYTFIGASEYGFLDHPSGIARSAEIYNDLRLLAVRDDDPRTSSLQVGSDRGPNARGPACDKRRTTAQLSRGCSSSRVLP